MKWRVARFGRRAHLWRGLRMPAFTRYSALCHDQTGVPAIRYLPEQAPASAERCRTCEKRDRSK